MEPVNAAIIYCSATGTVHALAQAINATDPLWLQGGLAAAQVRGNR